jgi:hypothetical protein
MFWQQLIDQGNKHLSLLEDKGKMKDTSSIMLHSVKDSVKDSVKEEAIEYFTTKFGTKMEPEFSLKIKKRLFGKSPEDDHQARLFLLLSDEEKGIFVQDVLQED